MVGQLEPSPRMLLVKRFLSASRASLEQFIICSRDGETWAGVPAGSWLQLRPSSRSSRSSASTHAWQPGHGEAASAGPERRRGQQRRRPRQAGRQAGGGGGRRRGGPSQERA